MRVIIKADYDALSRAAAEHVIKRINEACPTPEHPFVLGLLPEVLPSACTNSL